MNQYTSTILVTGGTQGLGYETTLHLATQCPSTLLIIAARSNRDDAATRINQQTKQSNVQYMPLNLGSLSTVRDFAKRWTAQAYPPISALILNAAFQVFSGPEYTDDGIEKSFAIAHVGHALLFHLLTSCLTSDARIVIVSSGVHDKANGWPSNPDYTTAEEVAHPSAAAVKKLNGHDRYATAKIANVLWTCALGRHMAESAAHKDKTVVALDPGLMMGTNLVRRFPLPIRALWKLLSLMVPLLQVVWNHNIMKPEVSGANMAWLAVSDEVKGLKGAYFEKRKEIDPSKQVQSEELQEDLWRWTLETVAENADEKISFSWLE